MRKLFTTLLIAIVLNGLTPAAPTTCTSGLKVSDITRTYVSASYSIIPHDQAEYIHPLDILSFRFN